MNVTEGKDVSAMKSSFFSPKTLFTPCVECRL